MTRMVLAGFWICLVTLVTGYFAIEHFARQAGAEPEAADYFRGIAYEKTRPVTVPIIAGGAVEGYVVAQFVYTAETRRLRDLVVPPDSFIVDEAFHHIFTSDDIDFRNLRAFDSRAFLAGIVERVNRRLDAPIVRELLLEELNFVDKEQLR